MYVLLREREKLASGISHDGSDRTWVVSYAAGN